MKIELPEPFTKVWVGSEEIPLYSDMQVMQLIRAERIQWQPIETAPIDEWLIVALAGKFSRLAALIPNDDGEDPTWTFPSGQVVPDKFIPTHWQPLPEPPSEGT